MSQNFKSGQLEVSNGNRKLGTDTVIFNMSSAAACPSLALGLCKVLNKRGECGCYAANQERLYAAVRPYRNRQEVYWTKVTVGQFMADFDTLMANSNALRLRVKFVRFNEAGDFHNQAEVVKAEAIARELKARGIQAYTYTARSDLDFSGCKALLIKGSGFEGCNNGMTIAREKGPALDAAKANGFVQCPGSCKTCKICKTPNHLNVVFAMH